MDLSLPRFTKLDDGVILKTKPWPVTEYSPVLRRRRKTEIERVRRHHVWIWMRFPQIPRSHDFKVTPLYDSEDSDTPVGSIVFSSDEDVPLSSGQEDRLKVRKRDPRPMSQPRPTDGMPGCPYRMTSYTGTAMVDADATYGLQLHHPRFLEFIGAPESARLLNHSPSGWTDWVRNVLWRQP